jgi:hypothetical protein
VCDTDLHAVVVTRPEDRFMASQDSQDTPALPEEGISGMSRRGLLRSAAGIGVAGVAAGLLLDTTAGTASAVQPPTATDGHPLPANSEPLVAHVHDARTGDVDFYAGEQHVRVHNPALAHALAHAATTGR